MPAILDDPAAATIYRVSGEAPYPDPAHPALPPSIALRHVTLRDRQTVATVVPFASRSQVPESLVRYLSDQFNKEIEGGDTYPMLEGMPLEKFAAYWFQNFAGIMLLGHMESADEVVEGQDWSKQCLGTFYIKPNYPGRSSHICNAGFIVTDAARNRGVGRLMGESYLDWAPQLGYSYSVFNLVYETNVASCRIWDALGFKRIGRVKGAGNLKSHPGRLIDAIIYGRDLGGDGAGAGGEELVSEERFDKIKYYLKYGRYPSGADRAEKSRLRSAATHYKLLEGDVLMLKDKEVISDPRRQYHVARAVHNQAHAGINKTTATIAERYHWSRIKETVSDVIRNCSECKELGKNSSSAPFQFQSASQSQSQPVSSLSAAAAVAVNNQLRTRSFNSSALAAGSSSKGPSPSPSASGSSELPTSMGSRGLPLHEPAATLPAFTITPDHYADPMLQDQPRLPTLPDAHHHMHHHHPHHHLPHAAHHHPISVYQPIDPQMISHSHSHGHGHSHAHHPHDHSPFFHPHPHHHLDHHHHPPDEEEHTFQALLAADVVDPHPHHHHQHHQHHHIPDQDVPDDDDVVDRDLEMLLSQTDEDEGDEGDEDDDQGRKGARAADKEMAGVVVHDGGEGRLELGRLLDVDGDVHVGVGVGAGVDLDVDGGQGGIV